MLAMLTRLQRHIGSNYQLPMLLQSLLHVCIAATMQCLRVAVFTHLVPLPW